MRGRRWPFAAALVAGAGILAGASAAHAANAAFQDYFFTVCDSPSGALAARCAETPGGTGDLSGNSESSLNPSQTLAGGDAGLAAARVANEHARDRAARVRSGETDTDAVRVGPFSLLINARGTFTEYDRTPDADAERGYDRDEWGAELGFDYRVSDALVLGALLVWETADTEFDRENPGVNFVPLENAGAIDTDRFGVTLFAALDVGARSYLQFAAGYLAADHDVTRNVVFQESGRVVPQTNVRTSANVDGTDAFVSALWGYLGERDGWTFGPYLGLLYARSETDSYTERDLTGSGLALAVDDYERESLLGTVGVRVGRGFAFGGGILLPEVRVEYLHEFERDAEQASTSLLFDTAANVFALEGDDPDRDYFTAGAGLVFLLPNGWMPFIDYQATLGYEDLDEWRITAGLRREL
jgi:outer membrane lipase/esterase